MLALELREPGKQQVRVAQQRQAGQQAVRAATQGGCRGNQVGAYAISYDMSFSCTRLAHRNGWSMDECMHAE